LAHLWSQPIRGRSAVTGLSLALLLVAISMVAGVYLKFKAFPSIDGDTVVARVLLPQGTSSQRTKEVVAQVERGLAKTNAALSPKQPDGARLVRHVTVFYGVNTDAFETGANVATISVDLLPSNLRNSRPQDITAHWRKAVGAIPDVISLRYSEPGVGRAGRAIDLRLKGDNLATLKAASTDLKNWLWQYRGVTSVMDDLRAGKRELRITLKDTAGPMGITAGMIADQLRAAYYGTTVSQMQVRGQELDVISEIGTLGGVLPDSAWRQFDDFVIARTDGSVVPLSVVANVTITQGYNRINRENGRRTVTVQGSIDTRIANAKAIVGDTIARFIPRLLKSHPGVKLDIEGQNAEARKTQKSMMKGFVIGVIGVFLLLSFLFRSYVEPIVVMLIIPLSLVGAVFGHMAMGLDFSMPSMLGYVALAGVVVNNSILLVDFVKHEHGNALTVAEAAARAAKSRFRAMFLTTATTIAGLIPILLATNVQAQVLIPMVASLAFGLLASAIFVLFVLPGIYAILDDLGFSTLARERSGDAL